MWTQAKIRGLEERRLTPVVTPPPQLRLEPRATILMLALGTIALWFLNTDAFRYFTVSQDMYGIYWPRRQWVLAHVLAGITAIMLGPVQLWLGLNRRNAIMHRVLGVLYVAAVLVGSVSAFRLAFGTDFGWVFGVGLSSMALAWMLTTGLAVFAISRRLLSQHREWMIRSYIVTFGFVTFRVMVDVLQLARVGTMTERLTAASWFCWAVPLLIAEAVIQGRKLR